MQIVYQDTRKINVQNDAHCSFVITWPSEVSWCIWIVPGTIDFD